MPGRRASGGAPVKVVHGVWAVMASAAQVHSRLVAVEARNMFTAAFVRYP